MTEHLDTGQSGTLGSPGKISGLGCVLWEAEEKRDVAESDQCNQQVGTFHTSELAPGIVVSVEGTGGKINILQLRKSLELQLDVSGLEFLLVGYSAVVSLPHISAVL